jgi:hypothetical protein
MSEPEKTVKSPRSKSKKEKSSKSAVNNDLVPMEMDSASSQHRIEVSYKDCDLVNVTVFGDRAELTRKICCELKEGMVFRSVFSFFVHFLGVNDVCVSGISNSVVQDSIRVNGGLSKSADVVILEVFPTPNSLFIFC